MAIYGKRKFIVSKLGSGYAAVEMVWVIEEDDGKPAHYWDVWQTGIGRYATAEEAKREAQSLSCSEEIPFED